MRVLVVDDCPDGAASLSLALASFGHDVRTALSGAEGIALFDKFLPDVVVCDLGMPDLSGDAVAQRLRARSDNRRPVLLSLSGDHSESAKGRSRAAGFDAHLAKPVDLDSLQAAMLTLQPSS